MEAASFALFYGQPLQTLYYKQYTHGIQRAPISLCICYAFAFEELLNLMCPPAKLAEGLLKIGRRLFVHLLYWLQTETILT